MTDPFDHVWPVAVDPVTALLADPRGTVPVHARPQDRNATRVDQGDRCPRCDASNSPNAPYCKVCALRLYANRLRLAVRARFRAVAYVLERIFRG